jgi:hypothetical protein
MGANHRPFYAQQLNLATPREWVGLVPKPILAEVAREHGGDQAGGKLSAPVHFWVLVVATLSKGCSSAKDLLSRFQARFGGLWGLPKEKDKPWVTPAALSQRNKGRPGAFWRQMYDRLRQHHFGAGWRRKAWQKRFVALEALDSSTFRLMARLRHVFAPSGSGGAKKGSKNSKGALKIHQVYNVGGGAARGSCHRAGPRARRQGVAEGAPASPPRRSVPARPGLLQLRVVVGHRAGGQLLPHAAEGEPGLRACVLAQCQAAA